MARASDACRRLMSIPGVGQLTALAFTAAVDDPRRFRRSRDIGAYLGLVPRRYQSGEVDYTGSISKCGDRRVRTLLYEAANVMLTRYKAGVHLIIGPSRIGQFGGIEGWNTTHIAKAGDAADLIGEIDKIFPTDRPEAFTVVDVSGIWNRVNAAIVKATESDGKG